MFIAEINSTNDYLRQHTDVDVVRTDYQTAGRGQKGNGWESERGKNLLFSVRVTGVKIAANQQWLLAMTVAVAVYRAVKNLLTEKSQLTIKWPNDLYYGDKKLAGILIENTLQGSLIRDSIAGVGLNLNQTHWISDAPNPISMKEITGEDYSAEDVMQMILGELDILQKSLASIKQEYMSVLYRRAGWWWWEEREVSLEPTMNGVKSQASFEARIADITEEGELILENRNKQYNKYHFKQIKYIL